MESKISINNDLCKKVWKLIWKLKLRKSFYEREFLSLKTENEIKFRYFLFSSAICHSTYKIITKPNPYKWRDQLEYIFLNFAKQNSNLINPDYLANISIEDLSNQFHEIFPDSNDNKEIQERAKFIIEISKIVHKNFKNSVESFINSSNWYLINNWKWVYEILDNFEAFCDPNKKKTTFFLKLLTDTNLFYIKDQHNIIPIMDYHMQRVLMRMWCIEIIDNELKYKLQNRQKLENDNLVRNASIDAIKIISKISWYEILLMNDFFYTLWTSCCRDTMLCIDKICTKTPCSFELALEIHNHTKCSFENICKWKENAEYRKFWQPNVETNFY